MYVDKTKEKYTAISYTDIQKYITSRAGHYNDYIEKDTLDKVVQDVSLT